MNLSHSLEKVKLFFKTHLMKNQIISEHVSNNSFQTKKLGEILSKKILNKKKRNKKAQVLALEGELGGGKTTFLQGFARGLGIKKRILSPTFVILKKFRIPDQSFKFFYHIDCYRIQKTKEISDLGFRKIISNPQNIVAIEWADHIGKILPKNTTLITFEFNNKNKRKIIIKTPFQG